MRFAHSSIFYIERLYHYIPPAPPPYGGSLPIWENPAAARLLHLSSHPESEGRLHTAACAIFIPYPLESGRHSSPWNLPDARPRIYLLRCIRERRTSLAWWLYACTYIRAFLYYLGCSLVPRPPGGFTLAPVFALLVVVYLVSFCYARSLVPLDYSRESDLNLLQFYLSSINSRWVLYESLGLDMIYLKAVNKGVLLYRFVMQCSVRTKFRYAEVI